MKFFSIIIPVYNPDKLEKALDSIEIQKVKEDIEVIIVNDAGSKDFESLLPRYSFNYVLITNDQNIGQGLSRQKGLDAATGEWVTFLDHDDEFTVNAFELVKKGIIESECEFVYSTQSIIAKDYYWAEHGEYTVEDSACVLHGHFYKLDKLKHYNIRFSDKIRAQEDTYFLSLLSGHILRDDLNYHKDKTEVKSPLITYVWYLWDDSTSHTDTCYKGEKISYLENTLDEYIYAIWESYKEIRDIYPFSPEFQCVKCAALLMYLYWFSQAFRYMRPNGWKTENVKYIRECLANIMREFNTDRVEDITNLLIDMPDLFQITFNTMLTNIDGPFVPRQTIEQFYKTIEEEAEQ